MFRRLFPLALLLAAPACTTAGDGGNSFGLAGSEWRATEIAGDPVPAGVEALLQFGDEGRLSGSGGCNRFTGTFEVVDGSEAITIGPLAATRMFCAGPGMEVENSLFAAFGQVRAYDRDGTRLVLSDADGTPLVALVQTDWD